MPSKGDKARGLSAAATAAAAVAQKAAYATYAPFEAGVAAVKEGWSSWAWRKATPVVVNTVPVVAKAAGGAVVGFKVKRWLEGPERADVIASGETKRALSLQSVAQPVASGGAGGGGGGYDEPTDESGAVWLALGLVALKFLSGR